MGNGKNCFIGQNGKHSKPGKICGLKDDNSEFLILRLKFFKFRLEIFDTQKMRGKLKKFVIFRVKWKKYMTKIGDNDLCREFFDSIYH